jgi:DNA polymerase III alpha subunit (gram-positive type)
VTTEELKQKHDIDAYGLIGLKGKLIRTHFITTNGIARTNPPPDDYLCDSCHIKSWLKLSYQDSKVDGANVPVWLCPNCSKLKPENRDVRF